MKKEKTIRTYQRHTKTGKVVTVKQHTAKYDAAEALKEAAKKKGAGDELEASKKKGELDLAKIDAYKGDPNELSEKEQQAWQILTGNYPESAEKKLRKMKSLEKVWAYVDAKGKKKSSAKAPKETKSSDSAVGFTADEYKAWYHWDQDADPKNAAAKKVEKALKAKMGAKGYKKYFDEMTDSYSSRGHNKAFKALDAEAAVPKNDAKTPKSKVREDLPSMKHGGDVEKDAYSHKVATSKLQKEGFKLGKDNLYHHADGRVAKIDQKTGKWVVTPTKEAKVQKTDSSLGTLQKSLKGTGFIASKEKDFDDKDVVFIRREGHPKASPVAKLDYAGGIAYYKNGTKSIEGALEKFQDSVFSKSKEAKAGSSEYGKAPKHLGMTQQEWNDWMDGGAGYKAADRKAKKHLTTLYGKDGAKYIQSKYESDGSNKYIDLVSSKKADKAVLSEVSEYVQRKKAYKGPKKKVVGGKVYFVEEGGVVTDSRGREVGPRVSARVLKTQKSSKESGSKSKTPRRGSKAAYEAAQRAKASLTSYVDASPYKRILKSMNTYGGQVNKNELIGKLVKKGLSHAEASKIAGQFATKVKTEFTKSRQYRPGAK